MLCMMFVSCTAASIPASEAIGMACPPDEVTAITSIVTAVHAIKFRMGVASMVSPNGLPFWPPFAQSGHGGMVNGHAEQYRVPERCSRRIQKRSGAGSPARRVLVQRSTNGRWCHGRAGRAHLRSHRGVGGRTRTRKCLFFVISAELLGF